MHTNIGGARTDWTQANGNIDSYIISHVSSRTLPLHEDFQLVSGAEHGFKHQAAIAADSVKDTMEQSAA